ncbi:MAG: N-acetylglucosamine-6-phosphate deacetylase, partial [Cyanobacteriota bacterium]
NDLCVENNLIKSHNDISTPDKYEIINAADCYVTPGLIDIHIHGGLGCNFLEFSEEKIILLKKDLLKHGVTSIYATVMTASKNIMIDAIKSLSEYINKQDPLLPEILGLNIEGPFLSSEYRGIQPEKDLLTLNKEILKEFLTEKVKILTLAPELDEYGINISYLKSNNIIPAMGHSLATFEQANKAIEQGIVLVTHLYNAMRRFHHRSPGILAASLLSRNVYTEIIADGIHVHPAAIELVVKARPNNKIILISDSIALRDVDNYEYFVGEDKITVKDNKAINNKGVLSGSVLSLDDSIRNLVKWGVVEFSEAINYASINPATLLGIDDKYGSIIPDKIANIVIWDKKTLKIKATIIQGHYHQHSAG